MSPESAVRGGVLLSAFGLGRLRPAPGTWASLATALAIGGAHQGADVGLAVAAVLFAYGCATTLAFGTLRGPDGSHGDPPWVVSDEVAGQAAATAGALVHAPSIVSMAVAFAAFRVLDVAKPGPIGRLQRLPGGQGVLVDDVVAGLVAGVLAWGSSFL